MPSLIESNPYLRDAVKRRRMIEQNVYESSVFEGATGLTKPAHEDRGQGASSSPRRMPSSKNRAKGE